MVGMGWVVGFGGLGWFGLVVVWVVFGWWLGWLMVGWIGGVLGGGWVVVGMVRGEPCPYGWDLVNEFLKIYKFTILIFGQIMVTFLLRIHRCILTGISKNIPITLFIIR